MSQDQILEILKRENRKMTSKEIIERIIAEGNELNIQSFYSNMKELEKTDFIKFDKHSIFRHGHARKFKVKRWWYDGNNE